MAEASGGVWLTPSELSSIGTIYLVQQQDRRYDGMDGLNVRAGTGGKEGEDQMLADVGKCVGASIVITFPPYASEEDQGAGFVLRKPSPEMELSKIKQRTKPWSKLP